MIEEKRAQRNSVVLRDVAYIIEASIYQNQISDKNKPEKYIGRKGVDADKKECFSAASKKGSAGAGHILVRVSFPLSLWSRMG